MIDGVRLLAVSPNAPISSDGSTVPPRPAESAGILLGLGNMLATAGVVTSLAGSQATANRLRQIGSARAAFDRCSGCAHGRIALRSLPQGDVDAGAVWLNPPLLKLKAQPLQPCEVATSSRWGHGVVRHSDSGGPGRLAKLDRLADPVSGAVRKGAWAGQARFTPATGRQWRQHRQRPRP